MTTKKLTTNLRALAHWSAKEVNALVSGGDCLAPGAGASMAAQRQRNRGQVAAIAGEDDGVATGKAGVAPGASEVQTAVG